MWVICEIVGPGPQVAEVGKPLNSVRPQGKTSLFILGEYDQVAGGGRHRYLAIQVHDLSAHRVCHLEIQHAGEVLVNGGLTRSRIQDADGFNELRPCEDRHRQNSRRNRAQEQFCTWLWCPSLGIRGFRTSSAWKFSSYFIEVVDPHLVVIVEKRMMGPSAAFVGALLLRAAVPDKVP